MVIFIIHISFSVRFSPLRVSSLCNKLLCYCCRKRCFWGLLQKGSGQEVAGWKERLCGCWEINVVKAETWSVQTISHIWTHWNKWPWTHLHLWPFFSVFPQNVEQRSPANWRGCSRIWSFLKTSWCSSNRWEEQGVKFLRIFVWR